MFAKLSKEFAELDPVVAAIRELRAAKPSCADLEAMAADAGADREMAAMARDELDGAEAAHRRARAAS